MGLLSKLFAKNVFSFQPDFPKQNMIIGLNI